MREHDVVRLLRGSPARGLAPGALGAIIHVFTRPNLAYEVEFCDDSGRTIAQLPLEPGAIEPVTERLSA